MTLRIFRNATPKINYFFNRMQIPSSIALALQSWSNDVQKSIGLIVMSFVILGFLPAFMPLLGDRQSCGLATAWERVLEDGELSDHGLKIYRLRSVHAFCAQLPQPR